MAIQSIDNLLTSISGGKSLRTEWNKITTAGITYTAGRSYDFSQLAGYPVANAWAGTALAWRSCDETTGNGTQVFGLPHGGNVSTDVKHLTTVDALTTAATGVPGTLILVDLQGYWPGISNNTGTAQTLTGTPSLRYTNGVGCKLYWVQTATAGASGQNIAISYSNTTPTAGNTLPVTVAMTASAVVGHISHAGVAANNYGPFLPLASGDTGVSNVATVTFSGANTGTGALCLAREIGRIPLGLAQLSTGKDFLNQFPSLPVIKDGACLVWLYVAGNATAASTTFMGANDVVWG
jgi:hypothetical protein